MFWQGCDVDRTSIQIGFGSLLIDAFELLKVHMIHVYVLFLGKLFQIGFFLPGTPAFEFTHLTNTQSFGVHREFSLLSHLIYSFLGLNGSSRNDALSGIVEVLLAKLLEVVMV